MVIGVVILIGVVIFIKTCFEFPRLFCCGRYEREEVHQVYLEEEEEYEEEEDYESEEYCEEDCDHYSRSIG